MRENIANSKSIKVWLNRFLQHVIHSCQIIVIAIIISVNHIAYCRIDRLATQSLCMLNLQLHKLTNCYDR